MQFYVLDFVTLSITFEGGNCFENRPINYYNIYLLCGILFYKFWSRQISAPSNANIISPSKSPAEISLNFAEC